MLREEIVNVLYVNGKEPDPVHTKITIAVVPAEDAIYLYRKARLQDDFNHAVAAVKKAGYEVEVVDESNGVARVTKEVERSDRYDKIKARLERNELKRVQYDVPVQVADDLRWCQQDMGLSAQVDAYKVAVGFLKRMLLKRKDGVRLAYIDDAGHIVSPVEIILPG